MNKKIFTTFKKDPPEDPTKRLQMKNRDEVLLLTVLDTYYWVRTAPGRHVPGSTGDYSTRIVQTNGSEKWFYVLGKRLIEGKTWYYVELAESSLVSYNLAKSMKKGERGWIIDEDGVYLVVRWPKLQRDLSAFLEKMIQEHPQESGDDLITRARQLMHEKAVPFNGAIGHGGNLPFQEYRDEISYIDGETELNDRNQFIDTEIQLGRDYEGVATPTGEFYDLQHIFVGLDVLRDPRANHTFTYYVPVGSVNVPVTIEVGYNVDAALWAGDIGAGVGDYVNQTNKESFEKDWIDRYRSRSLFTEDQFIRDRDAAFRTHYYLTRTPQYDALADILSYILHDMKEAIRNEILRAEPDNDLKRILLTTLTRFHSDYKAKQKEAFERFLHYYGLRSNQPLKNQPVASDTGRFMNSIYLFSQNWYQRKAESLIIPHHKLHPISRSYKDAFVTWLQEEVDKRVKSR